MDSIECMVKTLEKMGKDNVPVLIYYAEDMSDIKDNMWSVDVTCDYVNNSCRSMAWTWTVVSKEEDKAYREEFDDHLPLAEYEILVDEPFSDEVICQAIKCWLSDNGLGNYDFDIVMIDLKDAAPYSGYIRELTERDIDEELSAAVPLDDYVDSD